MIDISQLTEKDKGREVRYRLAGDAVDYGRITSWNDTFIFVQYHTRLGRWTPTPRDGRASAATRPQDLEFTQ